MSAHLREQWRQANSWRQMTHDDFPWLDHDVVVLGTGGASGRKHYEVYVRGALVATRPSLAEARQYVEERHGPQVWSTSRQKPLEVDHYYFGPTEEFSDPLGYWYVDGIGTRTALRFDTPVTPGERVWVYGNLHTGTLSIMRKNPDGQGWRVDEDFYVTGVELRDVEFRVRAGGHARVLDEEVKNVHAWVIGDFVGTQTPSQDGWRRARYNPYEADYFFDLDTGEPLGFVSSAYVTKGEPGFRDPVLDKSYILYRP